MTDDVLVDYRELFETPGDAETPDFTRVVPGARFRLLRLHATGSRIVVTGPLTDTVHGTRMVLSALYDTGLPFYEVDQCARWKTPTS